MKELYLFQNRSYVDFYPIQFGKENCDPLHSFGPSLKQHYLFHYIVSGEGNFYVTEEEKSFHLTAGQGFLIPPGVVCSYEADLENPWTYIWIEFDGLKAEHFLKQAGLGSQQLIFSQTKPAKSSLVYSTATAVLNSHNNRSAGLIAQLYLFIDALITESSTRTEINHSDAKDLYIREAINFVERNFQATITVDDMAQSCNLNRQYFSRLFKEQMNVTAQQFIIQYRLSQACEMLKNTNLSLTEIAERVGYSNQFNFSAAFKRQYKQSPSTWRRN